MTKYIVARVLQLIPVLVIVAIISFALVHLIPGDPATVILGDTASAAQISDLRHALGLDRPLLTQFFAWVGSVARGDFGMSLTLNEPVSTALVQHLPPTAELAVLAEVVALVIGIPLGTAAARKQGTAIDSGMIGFSLLGASIPTFLIGMFFVLIFAVALKALPASGYVPFATDAGQNIRAMVLPALALGLGQSALISRMTRAAMIETLSAPYIATARAKGVSESGIVYRHALQNAAVPILTVIGQSFGGLLAGAIVTETVFAIPGIGSATIHAVQARDFALIQGVVLFSALSYVTVNLIVDLLYAVLDPRIRIGR